MSLNLWKVQKHNNATVQMLLYVFGNAIFLPLQDIYGHVMGHSPLELVNHLKDMYVTTWQKKNETTKIDKLMRSPYSMDVMVEE